MASGDFDVQVNRGEPRTCPSRTEYSHDMNDCKFIERSCNTYFWRENYCQK